MRLFLNSPRGQLTLDMPVYSPPPVSSARTYGPLHHVDPVHSWPSFVGLLWFLFCFEVVSHGAQAGHELPLRSCMTLNFLSSHLDIPF